MSHLTIGDPVPWFVAPSTSSPAFHFDTVAGYRIVLFFFGSSTLNHSKIAIQQFLALQSQFETLNVLFFGVSIDPKDTDLAHQVECLTYVKLIWDFDSLVSQQYSVSTTVAEGTVRYTPTTFVLDQDLRILQVFPLEQETGYVDQVMRFVQTLTSLATSRPTPVLLIPNVLDPNLCRELINRYEENGGQDSGFMRQIDGKTVEVLDPSFKKRKDYLIQEPQLLEQINTLILRRVRPEIEKVFQFTITRFERYLVSCYEATNQGFFNRHRDNTTKGTAHRRFAMSLNLNTGDYEGGCLRFPEFGSQLYRPDRGEALIFSCSLLHEATPVTQGQRYTLLSFFYNDDDAKVREQNRSFVVLNQPQSATSQNSQNRDDRSKKKPKHRGFQPKSSHP